MANEKGNSQRDMGRTRTERSKDAMQNGDKPGVKNAQGKVRPVPPPPPGNPYGVGSPGDSAQPVTNPGGAT